MLNIKNINNSSSQKGKNNTRSNVIGSGKGGAFVIPKSKHNGHH